MHVRPCATGVGSCDGGAMEGSTVSGSTDGRGRLVSMKLWPRADV